MFRGARLTDTVCDQNCVLSCDNQHVIQRVLKGLDFAVDGQADYRQAEADASSSVRLGAKEGKFEPLMVERVLTG